MRTARLHDTISVIYINMEHCWNGNGQGEPKLAKKNICQSTLPTIKPTCTADNWTRIPCTDTPFFTQWARFWWSTASRHRLHVGQLYVHIAYMGVQSAQPARRPTVCAHSLHGIVQKSANLTIVAQLISETGLYLNSLARFAISEDFTESGKVILPWRWRQYIVTKCWYRVLLLRSLQQRESEISHIQFVINLRKFRRNLSPRFSSTLMQPDFSKSQYQNVRRHITVELLVFWARMI